MFARDVAEINGKDSSKLDKLIDDYYDIQAKSRIISANKNPSAAEWVEEVFDQNVKEAIEKDNKRQTKIGEALVTVMGTVILGLMIYGLHKTEKI